MKNLKQLRDERAAKAEALQAIYAKASGETRGLNTEERAQWETGKTELAELDQQIKDAEYQESLARSLAGTKGTVISANDKKDLRKYSLIKAVRGLVTGQVDGLEKEMHEEAVKEARELGVEIKNFGIPSLVLENRANSVTQDTQPEDGAQLVKDDYKGMIDLLKNALVARALGANYMTGLKGNVAFDKITQGATSTWKTEIAELDASSLKFGSAEMTPHRLGTYSIVSKQLLNQSSSAIENLIRQELMESIAHAVDVAAINGSGASNQPTGVLNTAGIGSVAIGANGGDPTYNHIVALENAVEIQNALLGNLKYLINPKVKNKLKTTKIDAGSGLFIMPGNTELNGYGAISSNMVPSDLTKGTAAGTCSAIVFGNWSDLLIGQWGGLDLMADPYTLATSGRIRLIVDSFWDVFVRRAASFAAIKDATTALV